MALIHKAKHHLENLGKAMDSSIKENPTHFFGDNGRLMSFKKLAKVNGLGIFDPPPTALVNGLLLSFFSVRNVHISQKIVNNSNK